MFCPFCGTVVEGGEQFCPNCGQQLPRSVDAGPIPTGGTIIDATVPDGTVVDGAMTGGTMPLGNQDFGTIPVQVPPVDSAPSAARPNKPGLDKGVWGIVIASVVVIALIIGGTIAFLHVENADNAKQAEQIQTESTLKKPATRSSKGGNSAEKTTESGKNTGKSGKKTESDTSKDGNGQEVRTLDKKSMDAIVDGVSTTEVGVSVMTEDGLCSYSSRNASLPYVAAGLYLPAWVDFRDTYNRKPDDFTDSLTKMDNDSANALIDAVGGESDLNEWLSDNKYSRTRFERAYGDVQASNSGDENYSSPNDAARMLVEMAKTGDDSLMNYDIASEGVSIPSGATVHALRGQGIRDAYNYFMVISNGKRKVSVAVMTQDQGRDAAARLTSRVLDQVWNTMLKN